jgi:hypothetical protein
MTVIYLGPGWVAPLNNKLALSALAASRLCHSRTAQPISDGDMASITDWHIILDISLRILIIVDTRTLIFSRCNIIQQTLILK